MILFHGTSSAHLDGIFAIGLDNPFLTNDFGLASHYANCAAAEEGDPVVLSVDVENTDKLRYDHASMDNPIGFRGLTSGQISDHVASVRTIMGMQHPDWLSDVSIYVPHDQWRVSLMGVGSVWYHGKILPRFITVAVDPPINSREPIVV